jgi:hypothetical protein
MDTGMDTRVNQGRRNGYRGGENLVYVVLFLFLFLFFVDAIGERCSGRGRGRGRGRRGAGGGGGLRVSEPTTPWEAGGQGGVRI